jgi:hypothetical protein
MSKVSVQVYLAIEISSQMLKVNAFPYSANVSTIIQLLPKALQHVTTNF